MIDPNFYEPKTFSIEELYFFLPNNFTNLINPNNQINQINPNTAPPENITIFPSDNLIIFK